MDVTPPPENRIDLSWGARRVKIVGVQMVLIVLLAIALGYQLWSSGARASQALAQHDVITTTLREGNEELSYVLLLPDGEKQRLLLRVKVPARFR